ncbi:photosynthetic protein synthase II [Flavobacterium noncentrifugens]|uniref:Protein SCO1/2 n=1 Tax=Flavobacterium noncentrifugens TaxID=1128970 RepID=A0A1G8RXH2_9FLAO|nr:SCO family protein [Flavobacterium noncentrifugens]GEP49603.1 photosynthetic protein synthase II [Flavobacterium noncentrifugens]SDJ21120.1 protein SCO1/2 [Flavobacterium noncentrifugens]
MLKNKSYIGISLVILIFGIYAVPKIIERVKGNDIVKGDRLDNISNNGKSDAKLLTIKPAPKFQLTDQNNKTITNADYAGKVYVLEFFFTTCPSICPKMNMNMIDIQNKFFGNPNFGQVSITINPENDTPAVLKSHADLLGVKSSNWHFLTGDKAYIYDIANKGFNQYAGENAKVNGGFEHSGLFALVDKKGNIRCRRDTSGNPILYYDGIEKEGVKAIQQDIAILLEE